MMYYICSIFGALCLAVNFVKLIDKMEGKR